MLKAYQQDMRLTVEERLVMPVGSLMFMTDQENTYLQQQHRQPGRHWRRQRGRWRCEPVLAGVPIAGRTITLLKEQE